MPAPVDRLLTKPITLIFRADSGTQDDWGSPILTETRLDTKCYVRLIDTTDPDFQGEVMSEKWQLFLPADLPMHSYDAVEMDGATYEVIGKPEGEWNARKGEVNHLKMIVERAHP